MKNRNRLWILVSMVLIGSLLLAGCKPVGSTTPSAEELAQQVAGTQMARATEMAVATLVRRVTELSAPTNTPMPTATPQPTSTATLTTAPTAVFESSQTQQPTTSPIEGEPPKVWALDGKCFFRMQYLGDVGVTPDTVMTADIKFNKTWRVKNTGTCPWEAGINDTYRVNLVFEGGDQMGGDVAQPIYTTTVRPGDVVDVFVELRTPSTAGTYTGYWLPTAAGNTRFGYGDKNQYSLALRIIVP